MQQFLVVAMMEFCVGLCPPAPGQIEAAISQGVAYLEGELNPQLGLLRESPVTAPITYWLATDNQLAAYALRRAGREGMADTETTAYALLALLSVQRESQDGPHPSLLFIAQDDLAGARVRLKLLD